MKATDVIKRDHRAAEALFNKFKKASQSEKEKMETRIFEALTTHESMEDNYFYPALKELMADDKMLAGLEREQVGLEADVLAARTIPGHRSARIESIIETVLAHAKKEESDIFPQAEKLLGEEELERLGDDMEPESAVANDREDEE